MRTGAVEVPGVKRLGKLLSKKFPAASKTPVPTKTVRSALALMHEQAQQALLQVQEVMQAISYGES